MLAALAGILDREAVRLGCGIIVIAPAGIAFTLRMRRVA